MVQIRISHVRLRKQLGEVPQRPTLLTPAWRNHALVLILHTAIDALSAIGLVK